MRTLRVGLVSKKTLLAVILFAITMQAMGNVDNMGNVDSMGNVDNMDNHRDATKIMTNEHLPYCLSMTEDALRLACYDGLFARQSNGKPAIYLSGVIKSALKGSPAIVLTDDHQANYSDQLQATAQNNQPNTVLTEIGVSKQALARYTPLSLTYDLDANSERGLWSTRPHNANYILPAYVHLNPNRNPYTPTQLQQNFTPSQMQALEFKFQLSVKTKAAQNLFDTNADLWFGYTQVSHWQVYNKYESRPFRAHDYEPELFLTQSVASELPFGGRLRMLGVGAVHHSNGQSDPLSRSWNRAYVMGGAEWGNLTVLPRLWTRLIYQYAKKPNDNPDIVDYYGYGDVRFLYQLNSDKTISGLARYNPMTGKGALQLDYVYPIKKGVSGYVQLFQGYGQSIIDYNHKSTSIGVGVMLNDWMGL